MEFGCKELKEKKEKGKRKKKAVGLSIESFSACFIDFFALISLGDEKFEAQAHE